MNAQKKQEFIEGIARLRISGEVRCPECGGTLGEEGANGRRREIECLGCGQVWPLYKVDEWKADDAFDSEEALNRLIGDARALLKPEPESSMGVPTNEERAETARAALDSQEKYHDADEGLKERIADLVTDLLHLARLNDIEPDYIIHMAQIHFDAEVEEEVAGG